MKLDKGEKKGFLIFISCSILIIVTGIIASILQLNATGPTGGRWRNSITTLSGIQIIWVGIIMLAISLIIFISMKKESNENN